MAESPEHQFLSQEFIAIAERFSRSRLFGYREAGRKKFDFSCLLSESRDLLLEGQTLWRHSEGVEKDVRTLVVGSDAPIRVYIASDTSKHRAALYEALADYKKKYDVSGFREIWIPDDFDADCETGRILVRGMLERAFLDDILFSVILGRLTPVMIRQLVNSTTIKSAGLEIAILHLVATKGECFPGSMAQALGVSKSTVRRRLELLQYSGLLLTGMSPARFPAAGAAARSLLRICSQLQGDKVLSIEDELLGIIRLLGMEPISPEGSRMEDWVKPGDPRMVFALLVAGIHGAARYGVDLGDLEFVEVVNELEPGVWLW